MATTTTTMKAHQKELPLNWEYWDQTPVPLSLQVPRTPQPFWYHNQPKMASKQFSIPRRPLSTQQLSPSLTDMKPAPKKEKMRPEHLPPLIIPRRQSSHKALLLQLQAVSIPGAVTLRKTSDSSQKRLSPKQLHPQEQQPQQPPYRQYQHERFYQTPLTPKKVQAEPTSQRVASAQCEVIKPVPIPIPLAPSVPPMPDNYPPNSSIRRRLSQVINRARSRSKSRDRRKSTKIAQVEPETPFLASVPYGTGNTLNLGTPFVNDAAPVAVEPADTPFLALRLEDNIPMFEEEGEFLSVINPMNHSHNKGKEGEGRYPDSAMTMTMGSTFLVKHKYPPPLVSNNQNSFVQSPARYYYEPDSGDDARAILPSQSPKKKHRRSWYTSEQEEGTAQRKQLLKRSSAVYGGRPGARASRKDTMSPRIAGNGFSARGGRPVSLPPWSKIVPMGLGKPGEMDVAASYAKMDPDRGFVVGGEMGRGRERERVDDDDDVLPHERVVGVKMEKEVERMDSFSSAVSREMCVAEGQDRGDKWKKPRVISQHEPEQELVDEFGEREKAALRELLEYVDSILGPTDTVPARSGVRCAGGDWSREQGWWRDVRSSLQ